MDAPSLADEINAIRGRLYGVVRFTFLAGTRSDSMNFKCCEQEKRLIIGGGRTSDNKDHSEHRVTVCENCGQFRVSGHANNEWFNVTYWLWDDRAVKAAGKANERALAAEK